MDTPKFSIVSFCCWKWGYGASDLTGVSRVQYDPSVMIVRVKCTGRVDVKHILEAIRHGVDGVMVVGWHPGECDFGDGNIKARQRVEFAKKVLDKVGLGGDRVNMYNVSAAEIGKFRDAIADMVEKIEKLGPNPLKARK